jgi:hypothetical protein
MKGAFATRPPSGANNAHEKSRRSLMFVLMDVCRSERPMASATLMKRLANSVRRIGSGVRVKFDDMVRLQRQAGHMIDDRRDTSSRAFRTD